MKRIISLFLILSILLSLSACFPSENPDNTPDNGGGDITEPSDDPNTLYSPTSPVVVIKSESDKTTELNALTSKIYSLCGRFAVVEMDSSGQKAREIVVGDTTRPITHTASEMLNESFDALIKDYEARGKYTNMLRAFAVYSLGSSVAIVWNDDEIASSAVSYFMEEYLHDERLVLEQGKYDFVAVDLSEQIIAEQDFANQQAWASAEELYGSEFVQILREYLDQFDDRFYLWLASLYESEATDLSGNVIGGAFYYSNSARDNLSYGGVTLLPDLESTYQVLSFMSKSGMLDFTSYIEAIPEEMREQMISFARSLQSSVDGYFYHPQWGSNISTSRLSRDCSWGGVILSRLGAKPYWNTPSGTSGIYGAPTGKSASTRSLMSNTSELVRDAVRASDVWTGLEQLATLDSWETYLRSIAAKINIDSYSIGNTLSSQNAQIKNRDKLAIKTGECADKNGDGIADGGYIELFREIMDECQQENGLWEKNVSYNSINGLMKIVGAYGNLGLSVNRADQAIEAALSVLLSDTSTSGITDVYNPWVAINSLINNIVNYGDVSVANRLREIIRSRACEMVEATGRKISEYARDDGSYSYNKTGSPYKSQGAIVAVRGSVEGDINGGTIAYTGIWSSMCGVLGIEINPLGFEDFIKFIEAVKY